MDIIQSIKDYFNSIDLNIDIHIDFLMILKNLGVIAIGAFSLPILFIIILILLGFTTTGIVAGSAAASWMSRIGNVSTRSLFSSTQSLSTKGFSLIFLPIMLKLELIMGLLTTVFLLYSYSFDVDALLNDLSMMLHSEQVVSFILLGFNYFLSILIDFFLGMIIGSMIGYCLYFIIQFISGWSSSSYGSIYLPISENGAGSRNNNNNDKRNVLLFLLAFTGMILGVCIGIYIGIFFPFHFFG